MPSPRGRGALSNATGRFEPLSKERVDDGWEFEDAEAPPPPLRTEIAIDASRSVLTRNKSPDLAFDRSINPYRGCEHGCVYCFARPTHAYLGMSPGLDFETRLIAKPNAPELLRAALAKKGYRPAPIAIGTNTDPYQPVEKHMRIMRGVLETLLEARHPVTIVTKGALIMRDADLLAELARLGLARAAVSLTTLDPRLARSMEPRASSPARRLAAMEALSEAGVPMAVMTAPIIPGLNDHEIEALLGAAQRAGATRAGYVTLRLPLEVATLFQEWLAAERPDRAGRIMKLVREMQGGGDYNPEWGARLRGKGPFADLIARRFEAAVRRLGLDRRVDAPGPELRTDLFRPPSRVGQLNLDFD